MANITLLDTGFPNTTNAGTKLTGNDIANSGNAFTLKGISITLSRVANVDDATNPARYADTELNFTGFENRKVAIRGTLDPHVSGEVDTLATIDAFAKTKGLKLLYYNSTSDGYQSIISALGVTSVGSLTVDGSTKFIVVRLTGLSVTQNASNTRIDYTLDGVTTTATTT